jgi:hypothetical protein
MKRKWIVLSGLFIVIVGAVFVLPRYMLKDLELPKSLGSLQLQKEIRGEQARALINNMHGKGVTPKDNMIAVYGDNSGSATAYLSVYDSRSQSEETFQQMTRGIEKGTSPFSDFKRMTIRGQEISFCVGFGQAHYFFFLDESVYWLTADFGVAEEAVRELIGALKGESVSV